MKIGNILKEEKPGDIAHALICGKAYDKGHLPQLIIAQAIVIISLLLCLFWIYKFIKRMNHFPVKERAPILAMYQSFCFVGIIFIPYLSEYFIDFWEYVEKEADIPISRKIFKALYFTVRASCYLIFIPR